MWPTEVQKIISAGWDFFWTSLFSQNLQRFKIGNQSVLAFISLIKKRSWGLLSVQKMHGGEGPCGIRDQQAIGGISVWNP